HGRRSASHQLSSADGCEGQSIGHQTGSSEPGGTIPASPSGAPDAGGGSSRVRRFEVSGVVAAPLFICAGGIVGHYVNETLYHSPLGIPSWGVLFGVIAGLATFLLFSWSRALTIAAVA